MTKNSMESADQRYWLVFTGSYAASEEQGINVLLFDSETGKLRQHGGTCGVTNPSFLAFDEKRYILYAVSENEDGEVVAIHVNRETGAMELMNRQSTKGAAACHLSLDPSGNWLYAVNYEGGNVCVFPIGQDGAIMPMTDTVQHEGASIHPDRQTKPHPHSVISDPSGDYRIVPDLGTDRVVIYTNDLGTGAFQHAGELVSAPGAGPRHACFHRELPLIYVLEELSSTVTVFSFNKDEESGQVTGEQLQTIPMLPLSFDKESTAADIHFSVDGKYLYASNRGHDSLAVYELEEDGRLKPVGHISTGGMTPRNFAVAPGGRYVLAANQDTDSIVVLRLDHQGLAVPAGPPYKTAKPVCIVMTPAPESIVTGL
ncbi:lactonase family protein [Paenibacillus sambharensis]|uniref:Lactonase family protein n=1 Tax=Paenibacillus sambharensis TaxID=1803190 RepID=A0A2W1LND9_9BACL|nr:lactonase family protein [Paenibacillus sambharensis]PZD92927.1 lactonase family protein [Paenibacillus sambharensis]